MTFAGKTPEGAMWISGLASAPRPVINLTGTLTTLGGISARPEAIDAAAAIMGKGVDIVELAGLRQPRDRRRHRCGGRLRLGL